MYKIAICDDDKRYRKTIREIVEHENSLHENEIRFYEYESGNELLKHTDILHELVFIDIRMPGLDGNQTALKLRNYNKDAVLILGQWPMCDIVLSLWKGKSIIHFSLDMLITDFMSANLILNDLDNYYHGKAVEVKVETLYRDIVLYNQRKSMSKSKERKKAERYWQDKIRNMGTAPELIINNQKTGERETFKQLKFFIDEEGKENINEIAKELRVTASTVILTAFGEVINKWSKRF